MGGLRPFAAIFECFPTGWRLWVSLMKLRFLLLTGFATTLAAEPAWKKELTPDQPGDHAPLPSCSLDLVLSWKGMVDSGRIRMEVAPNDVKKTGNYVIRSTASSTGAAATLFPYQNSFWSELDPVSMKPRYFHAVEKDNKETVTTTTRHFPDRVETREITRSNKGGRESKEDRVFDFAPTYDIFSAMMHIRSQKLANGDQVNIVVHPFGTPYLLRVKVLGRENHMDRKTIRMSVGMRKIDRKTLELKPYKKLNSDATLWLSDDENRIPVEFRAAVFIGDVRATLTGFKKS